MSTQLYRVRPNPGDASKLVLRPFAGGLDKPFNTRWRDVTIGSTKPSAATTGVLPGSALTVMGGDQTLTTPGVYRNIDFQGHVYCRSMGLEFYNCRFRGGADGLNLVDCTRPNTSALFVDCTFRPDFVTVNRVGIFGGNYRAIRCQVSNCTDFFGVVTPTGNGTSLTPNDPTNVIIEGCYGYDFLYWSPDPSHADTDNATHNDGVQIHGGSGTIIRGNYFNMTESPDSTVEAGGHPSNNLYGQGVTLTPVVGNISNVLIEKNWLSNGVAGFIAVGSPYTLQAAVKNNRFGPVNPRTIDGITAARRVIVRVGDTIDNFPLVTGPDTVAGNINLEDGTPVTVWRTAA